MSTLTDTILAAHESGKMTEAQQQPDGIRKKEAVDLTRNFVFGTPFIQYAVTAHQRGFRYFVLGNDVHEVIVREDGARGVRKNVCHKDDLVK